MILIEAMIYFYFNDKKKQRTLIACSMDFLQNYENQIIFDCCYFVLCGFVGKELFWIENPFDQEGM